MLHRTCVYARKRHAPPRFVVPCILSSSDCCGARSTDDFSMASAAAARLQHLLHSFVSHNLDHGVKKLVPDSCNDVSPATSLVVALDATETLECLPFYAASLQPLSLNDGILQLTHVPLLTHAPRASKRATFTSLLQFLGSVVEAHLHIFLQDVSAGPPFRDPSVAVSAPVRRRGSSADSLDEEEAESDQEEDSCAATPQGCDGGPRVNFIAWVALEVHRRLAAEAESSLRERRARGGTAAVDAGVRTAAYAQWEQAVRCGCLDALAPHVTGPASPTDAVDDGCAAAEEKCEGGGAGAAALKCSLDAYRDSEDVFTNEPHFFSTLVRTKLLPYVKERVTGQVTCGSVDENGVALAAELRQWARSSTRVSVASSTSFAVTEGDEHSKDDLDPAPVPAFQAGSWKRLVQLLLGRTVLPMLDGGDVYEESGLLRPQTPALVAAYVAAAVVSSLVPGVVSAASRWLDSVLLSVHRGELSSRTTTDQRLCSSFQEQEEEEEEGAAAVQHALDVCVRSLQVVPLPLCDGLDAGQRSDAQVAGGWLLPSPGGGGGGGRGAASPLQAWRHDAHGARVSGWRRAVVLPGLSIAATRICSLAPVQSSYLFSVQNGARHAGTSDATTPAGSCVASPAGALTSLLVRDAQLDASAVPGHRGTATATITVSVLSAASLRTVEWLLLFTELPDDEVKLDRIRASVNASVLTGWVVLVVQASVAKATLTTIESAWGSAERPVLVLSAVGQWGLQQLSLCFDEEANTAFTDPCALRGVRRGDRCNGFDGCGVAALLLLHTEHREQLLFVVGATGLANTESVEHGKAHPVDSPQARADAKASPPAPPLPSMSMFYADSSSGDDEHNTSTSSSNLRHGSDESRDNDNSSSSSSNSSNSNSNSGGSSCFSTPSCSVEASARERAARRLVAWYGNTESDMPFFPVVTRSVLLGATTRGTQRELTYLVVYWWRLLLHRLVLPHELAAAVNARGSRSANVAAMQCLDTCIATMGLSTSQTLPCAHGTQLHRLHLLRVLREALWSYELLAIQHDEDGRSLDEAWATLQQWVRTADKLPAVVAGGEPRNEDSEESGHTFTSANSSAESWLQVQSAYLALGGCIDELCRTVVLAGAAASSEEDAAGEANDLSFLPMI